MSQCSLASRDHGVGVGVGAGVGVGVGTAGAATAANVPAAPGGVVPVAPVVLSVVNGVAVENDAVDFSVID